MTSAASVSPQSYARTAGAFYLAIVVLGIWSEVAVRGDLLVAGDADATAANIVASQGLFRMSFVADTLMVLADVAVAILLFVLLAPVSRTLSALAATLRLVQAVTIVASLVLYYGALLILTGAVGTLGDQTNALALLALELHGHGYDLGLVFFGVSSIILGYLFAASGYLPRALGLLMACAGAVYLVGSGTLFLAPDQAEGVQPLYVIPLVSELTVALWLLIRGVNGERWAARASAAPV